MGRDYIYQVARIRVRETALLTRADLEQLLAEPTYADALAYLSDKGWGAAEAGQSADAMLAAETRETWALMDELLGESDALDVLRLTRDYQNLKAAIKQLYTNARLPEERLYENGGTVPVSRILEAVREQNFDLLPPEMAAAAEEATDVLARTGDGQLCDNIIDRAALLALTKAGEAAGEPALREYASITAVSADIRIALRSARSAAGYEQILKALSPVQGLDLPALAEAAANGRSAVADYLRTTEYADLAEALAGSLSAFECACDNLMLSRIRPQLSESFTLGPLVAYVIARENEIKCVRLLLTGKQNGLPEQVLRESLRDTYV